MAEFQTEQGKISAVEKKAGQIDKETAKKTHEQLEAELKAKHDVFFKQVDDTQKTFDKAKNITDPAAKTEIDRDKTEIKNLLVKAAQSGENILAKTETDPNFVTIRQSAERISKLTSSVEDNMKFFMDMRDGQKNFDESVKPWMEKADAEYVNKDKPDFNKKDYKDNLSAAVCNLGEFGALGYILPYATKLPSPEYKAIYERIKKPMMDAMENLLAKQAEYTEKYEYDTPEKKDKMPVGLKQILAIRNANGGSKSDGPYGIGYEALGRFMTAGKKSLDDVAKFPEPANKKTFLTNARTYFMDVNVSAIKVVNALNEIDDKELPEEYQALKYCMKNAASAYILESYNYVDKIDKGNEAVDNPAVVDAVEKEYGEGDDSPKKAYENATKVRDSVMDAKEFNLNSPLLGPAVDKGLGKLCALKGKLAAVDRSQLPREAQIKYDTLSSTIDTNIRELAQVQILMRSNKLAETINKDGKEYFRVIRKNINGMNVVVIEQTEEFKKLPPEQQKIIQAQFAAVPAEVTFDLTKKMDLKEDKDWNEGIAKFESGNWQAAKVQLLAYYNKFSSYEDKAIQVNSAQGILQAIVKIEFEQSKERFEMMDAVQKDRGDIAGVGRQQLGVSVLLGWKKIDAAESIVMGKKCPLTIEEVWSQVGKAGGYDLKSEGISFMDPRVQQKMLSEPDPVQRKANILELARAAKAAGMTPFAKKYFEMYFASEIAEKKKTVTREQVESEFNKTDHTKDVQDGIKAAHDQARVRFITEMNRKQGQASTTDEVVNKWEKQYKQSSGDIESQVRKGLVDDLWQREVKKSIHSGMVNSKAVDLNTGALVKDAPVNVWNEAYSGSLGVAENITGSKLVFTSDDIRNTAAQIAVGIIYLEVAVLAGVVTGGAASAAVLGGEAVVGAGTLFASQAVGFVVEGAVMHTVSVALNEGSAGFQDPKHFMKGLATTYATLGIMKGAGAVLGKVGSGAGKAVAEGSGEFITPFSKGAVETLGAVGKGALKFTGKAALDSTLMTGLTYGTERLFNGKAMTSDELLRTFGDNMVTFMVMGIGHVAGESGKEVGKAKEGKEVKKVREAIQKFAEADVEAVKAREKADAAKKAGSPEAKALEVKAKELEMRATENKTDLVKAETAERQAHVEEIQKKTDAMKKELERKDLDPKERKRLEFLVEQFEKVKADGGDLAKVEKVLFEEHRVVEVPDPENPGKTKKIDLFENFSSKNFAYSKEMLELMNDHAKLLKEGPKIIKHGGDEIVVLHAGPDGKVQMFFGDIGNMGPTNEFALKMKGNDANMVDLYLRDFSQTIKARFKPGQAVDGPALLNEIKNNLSKKYFGMETEAQFNQMKAQWNLDGTWEQYQVNMGNARILAGFRTSARGLQKEFAAQAGDRPADPARDANEFSAFIEKKIKGLDTGTPPLTDVLKNNLKTLEASGALKEMFPDIANGTNFSREQLENILGKSERTAEENMLLYFALQRVSPEKIGSIGGMDSAGIEGVRGRFGKIKQAPGDSSLMDFQMAGIDVPKFDGRKFDTADMKFFLDKVLEDGLHEAKTHKDKVDIYKSENPFDADGKIRSDHPDAKKLKDAHDKAKLDKKAKIIDDTVKLIADAQKQLDGITKEIRELLDKKTLSDADKVKIVELKKKYDSTIEKLNQDKFKDAETGADRPGKYAQDMDFWMRGRDGKPVDKANQMYREFVLDMNNTGAINGQKGYAVTDAAMRSIAEFLMARFPGASSIIRTGGGQFKLVYLDGTKLPQQAGKPMDMAQHQSLITQALPELNRIVQAQIKADTKTVVDGKVRDATESFRTRGGKPAPVGEVKLAGSQDINTTEFAKAAEGMKGPRSLYRITGTVKKAQAAHVKAPPAVDYPIAAE